MKSLRENGIRVFRIGEEGGASRGKRRTFIGRGGEGDRQERENITTFSNFSDGEEKKTTSSLRSAEGLLRKSREERKISETRQNDRRKSCRFTYGRGA